MDSNDLKKWLYMEKRHPCEYSIFDVYDLKEKNAISDQTKEHLKHIIYSQLFDEELIEDLVSELGWDFVIDNYITIPKSGTPIKKGDFGEILFSAILEQFNNYTIPFYKVYFKIFSSHSLPRTDILALRCEKSKIVEVCLIESKLRLSNDNYAASNGAGQLYKDYHIDKETKIPDILRFTLKILKNEKSEILNPFIKYLGERENNENLDNFGLGLCYDKKCWDEKNLENLNSKIPLDKLDVYVIPISNLDDLIEEVFSKDRS